MSWNKLDKFIEAPSIEWNYFFHITINTTVHTTPSLLLLLCLSVSIIVVVAVAFIVIIAAVFADGFLVIVILYTCLIGIIGLQLIECVVVYISILIKLALLLVIGLNTNNSVTEKGSARKLLYKYKPNVTNGYACIGIILIILVLAPFFSITIFE